MPTKWLQEQRNGSKKEVGTSRARGDDERHQLVFLAKRETTGYEPRYRRQQVTSLATGDNRLRALRPRDVHQVTSPSISRKTTGYEPLDLASEREEKT